MGLLRSPDGTIVTVPDEQGIPAGYTPVTPAEAGAPVDSDATGGLLGAAGAGASSILSGATLGLSDLALKGVMNRGDFRRLAADREEHPVVSGAGQVVGALAPAVLSGGAATPAGFLSRATAGLAEGSGLGGAALATGIEGAVQNAGVYLSDTALGDRDLTAQGMAGALGTGFAFGSGGAVAAHGIQAGTIAARRMFARVAEGGDQAAKVAAQEWATKSQAMLEAYDQTADAARAQLAAARAAREQAGLARQQAGAGLAEARATAPAVDAARAPLVALDDNIAKIEAQEAAARAAVPPATGGIEDLQKIIDHLDEYTAARRAFDDMRARVDPDLEGALQGLGEIDLQAPAVPIGEFGAPGARGVKSPDDLARAAAEVGQAPAADATLGARPGRLAEGTPARAPSGFDPALRSDGQELFSSPVPLIREGIPDPGSIDRATFRDHGYVVTPSELAERGTLGIRSGADMVADARTADVVRAWKDGHAVPAIEVDVDPAGRYFVADGNHRVLAAALEGDRPMLARFRPIENSVANEEPLVSDIRRALGESGATASAETSLANTDSAILEQQLHESDPKVAAAIDENKKIAEKENYKSSDCATGACDTAEPQFRMIAPGFKPVRLDLNSDEGLAKIKKLYGMNDEQVAAVRAENERRIAEFGARREDMWHQISVNKDGIAVDWTANQFRDLPVPYVFRYETSPIANAKQSLTGLLRGTQEKLAAGESLPAIGAPASAEYAAAKAARTEEAAQHFRAQAIAARAESAPWNEGIPRGTAGGYEGSGMAASEAAARQEALAQRAGIGGRGQKYAVQREHPIAVKQLELAHDEALERAATAADPAERRAAAADAKAIEKQMTKVGARPGAVEDVAAMAAVTTRVEKAAAALTETVGDVAPAAAKEAAAAYRAAEDEASRKTVARIARAADDGAVALVPGSAGPDRRPGMSGSARISAAKQASIEADAAFARARVAETEASIGAKAARSAASDARAAAQAGSPVPAEASPGRLAGLGAKVLAGAQAVEVAHDVGIPGIPNPHDIPVIGPLLSTYLKYRTLRAAAGRFMGRVPATAETKAAALAARTKDKIATAVDRSLGIVERNTPVVRAAIVVSSIRVNDALSRRAFDDGHPDAPAGASPQALAAVLAAVRMREVAAAATNPQLVVDKVRKETRAITDPDLIDALEKHLIGMYQHLNDTAPKGPPPNPYTRKEWQPSAAEALQWGSRLAVANDPTVAFDALHAQALTPAMADTIRVVYDRLFAMAQQRVIERAADLKNPVPYRQLAQNAMLFDVPLHASLDPENASVLATAHAQAPAAHANPTPSIANATDLSKIYQTTSDRRSAQR